MAYLFPFSQVKYDSKIIIYGAGKVGQTYLWQLQQSKYCKVLCFLDGEPKRYCGLDVEVHAPQDIIKYDFDFIVVAIGSCYYAQDIIKKLRKLWNIPLEKIVYHNQLVPDIIPIRDTREFISEDRLAFHQSGYIPVAVNLTGGLGDMIVYKRQLEEIMKWGDDILIDVYASVDRKNFLVNLFSLCNRINIIIGSQAQYQFLKAKYAAAFTFGIDLDLDAWNLVLLAKQERLVEQIKLIAQVDASYGHFTDILSSVHYARCEKDGLNRYTAYNRYPGFQIKDYHTNIPLNKNFQAIFSKMNLNNYITINYGWDRLYGMDHPQAKVWPLEYQEKFVQLFRETYPKIEVIQVGAKGFPKLNGCNRYIMGENLELVKYILRSALLHVDCEGGLVHLATQLGTKCVVLFGPTPIKYYGYRENINVQAGTCHNCYWLVSDFVSCYRKLDKPECMYAIKPEFAIGRIKEYMQGLDNI